MWVIGQKGYPVVKVSAIGLEGGELNGYTIKACIDGSDKRGFNVAEYACKEQAELVVDQFISIIGLKDTYKFPKDITK